MMLSLRTKMDSGYVDGLNVCYYPLFRSCQLRTCLYGHSAGFCDLVSGGWKGIKGDRIGYIVCDFQGRSFAANYFYLMHGDFLIRCQERKLGSKKGLLTPTYLPRSQRIRMKAEELNSKNSRRALLLDFKIHPFFPTYFYPYTSRTTAS